MIFVKADGEADEQGWKRVTLRHHKPEKLKPEVLTLGKLVDPAALTPPETEPLERAEPWLTPDGTIEWKIIDNPDDDPQVMASRLARTEARLEALLTVAETKDLVIRTEVDQEETRTRDRTTTRR